MNYSHFKASNLKFIESEHSLSYHHKSSTFTIQIAVLDKSSQRLEAFQTANAHPVGSECHIKTNPSTSASPEWPKAINAQQGKL